MLVQLGLALLECLEKHVAACERMARLVLETRT
jgi:hypothetical protein